MKLRKLFRVKKSRKYPIRRDGEGLSLRARCFDLFEEGKSFCGVISRYHAKVRHPVISLKCKSKP